jgi:hypothetical protein
MTNTQPEVLCYDQNVQARERNGMATTEGPRHRQAGSGAVRLPLKAGGLYFGAMFVLGWVTGLIRELLIIPLLGRTTGIVVEALILIGAMVVVVGWINWLLEGPFSIGTRAVMALVAIGLLLPVEIVGAWLFRGQTPAKFLFPSEIISAVVQWGLLLVFTVMPLLVGRRWTLGDDIAS